MKLRYGSKIVIGAVVVAIVVIVVVTLLDIPKQFGRMVTSVRVYAESTRGPMRTYILTAADFLIPIKDRLAGKTPESNLAQLRDTGVCQFCDLTGLSLKNVNFSGTDLRNADLSNADLSDVNLSSSLMRNANLSGADLSGANLNGARLDRANLRNVNLTGAILGDGELSNTNYKGIDEHGLPYEANLSGANLNGANLSEALLIGVDLGGADLSKVNLTGANLTGANLVGAILVDAILDHANLSKTFLYSVDFSRSFLRNTDLTGARLNSVDFTDADLTGAKIDPWNLKLNKELGREADQKLFVLKDSKLPSGVTSFDMSGERHYLTTKTGLLYEWADDEITILEDFKTIPGFISEGSELGLLSVASNDSFLYVSYTSTGDMDNNFYLNVDEYLKPKQGSIQKTRSIFRAGTVTAKHHAGTLVFDKSGQLYLSIGDGAVTADRNPTQNPVRLGNPQNLDSPFGKILRFDVSKTIPKPEIIAYGLRNPWKIGFDVKDRLFIADCGYTRIESLYLIEDLYPPKPHNLGWPVFEGTERRKIDPLQFASTLAPIYEYRHFGWVGGCIVGGIFLEQERLYVLGDFSGIIRILEENENGNWYEIYSQHLGVDMWSFGHDIKDGKYYVGGSKSFELRLLPNLKNYLPKIKLCGTLMPDGERNNSGCTNADFDLSERPEQLQTNWYVAHYF